MSSSERTSESLSVRSGDEALLEETLVRLRRQIGLVEVRLDGRRGGLLVHELALEAHLHVRRLGLRGLELPLGVGRVARELGVRHLEEDGVGLHDGAWLHEETLDAAVGCGGEPANSFRLGDERSGAAHLAEHRALLDRVDPDGALLDGGRRGLQPREAEREEKRRDDPRGGENQPAAPFGFGDSFACDIHGRRSIGRGLCQRRSGVSLGDQYLSLAYGASLPAFGNESVRFRTPIGGRGGGMARLLTRIESKYTAVKYFIYIRRRFAASNWCSSSASRRSAGRRRPGRA